MDSLKDRMIRVMGKIKNRTGFETTEHKTVKYGDKVIAYYYSDSIFFEIGYGGFKVNIIGQLECDGIGNIPSFDLDKWLTEIEEITNYNICIIEGKEYIMTPVK